jgi:hypothetical protein
VSGLNRNRPTNGEWLQTGWRWIRHWCPHAIVIAIGPSILAVAALTTDSHVHIGHRKVAVAPLLIVFGAVLLLLASFWLVRRQRRLDQLERSGADLRGRAESGERALLRLARAELNELRSRLNHYTNERMSLFRCEGNCFTLVARFSAGPNFDRSPGRDSYPLGDGVLGRAWRDGSAHESAFPPAGEAVQPNRTWLQSQERLGIPEPTAAAFNMRSRYYAAFRIEGRDGPLGVLVIESVVTADEAAERQLKGRAFDGSTILDHAVVETEVKAASSRLARLLEEARTISAVAIEAGRRAIREESFGVFRAS